MPELKTTAEQREALKPEANNPLRKFMSLRRELARDLIHDAEVAATLTRERDAARDALRCVYAGVSSFNRKVLATTPCEFSDDGVLQIPVLWGALRKVQAALAAETEEQ